jgi:plasmid stabilization system protein ParE
VSRRFVVRPHAEAELDEAAAWYSERSRGLGAEFVRVVDAAFSSIQRNPLQFPLVYPPIRRAVVRRFPYAILFRVTEEEIVVLSVFQPGNVIRHRTRRRG